MRKIISILISITMVMIAFGIVSDNAEAVFIGDIKIYGNGSVTPGAPVIVEGNTYTLTDDVKGSIIIYKPGIVLDGAGHMIEYNSGADIGVHIYESFVTVKNLHIRLFDYGIYCDGKSYLNILGNTISGSLNAGIWLSGVVGSTITGNVLTADIYAVCSFYGIHIFSCYRNTISGNHIDSAIEGLKMYWPSTGNEIFENTFVYPNYITMAYSNTVYHNNFYVNSYFVIGGFGATWNNDAGEGNYWSDYTGEDQNNDGIGDTEIPHHGVDLFPLMEPWRPGYEIDDIISMISVLGLPAGTENSLISILDNAQMSANNGNLNAVDGKIGAFTNKIDALLNSGRISSEEAARLISAAGELILQ